MSVNHSQSYYSKIKKFLLGNAVLMSTSGLGYGVRNPNCNCALFFVLNLEDFQ